jgi:hypothetical protein
MTPSHLPYLLYHFETEAFNPYCTGDRLLSPPTPLRPYKNTSTSPFSTALHCPAPLHFLVLLASCPRKEATATSVRCRRPYLAVEPAEEILTEVLRHLPYIFLNSHHVSEPCNAYERELQ